MVIGTCRRLVALMRADEEPLTVVSSSDMAHALTSHRLDRRINLMRRELDGLMGSVNSARHDIAALKPAQMAAHDLPAAQGRLGAVLRSSENAATQIISKAEALLALADETKPPLAARMEEIAVAIIEAAAFQDITGQHVARVLDVLQLVETRLARLAAIIGDDAAPDDLPGFVSKTSVDACGPDWAGQGIDQSAIDQLFDQAAP